MLQFLWDEANIQHVARHGVTQAEVGQAIRNSPLDVGLEMRNSEERLTQIGKSDQGRILIVISTWRAQRLRIVTAWPAKARARKMYERRKQTHPTRRTQAEDI